MTNVITAPEVYKFDDKRVRVIVQEDGSPWFIAGDVCKALRLSNSRMALQSLDEDEKDVSSTYTLGGEQNVAIVSESGMYTLILRCRDAVKPGTVPHRFRRWITSEVLPAIRMTGSYKADPVITAALADALQSPKAMKAAVDTVAEQIDAFQVAIKNGRADAVLGRGLPEDVLVGLVVDTLSRTRFLVSYDYSSMKMQAKVVTPDQMLVDTKSRESLFGLLYESIPAELIPEAMRILASRIDSRIQADAQRMSGFAKGAH